MHACALYRGHLLIQASRTRPEARLLNHVQALPPPHQSIIQLSRHHPKGPDPDVGPTVPRLPAWCHLAHGSSRRRRQPMSVPQPFASPRPPSSAFRRAGGDCFCGPIRSATRRLWAVRPVWVRLVGDDEGSRCHATFVRVETPQSEAHVQPRTIHCFSCPRVFTGKDAAVRRQERTPSRPQSTIVLVARTAQSGTNSCHLMNAPSEIGIVSRA